MKESSKRLPDSECGTDILLFDGVCALCDFLVQFVLARDSKARFRFSSLQSEFARGVLLKYGLDPQDLNTFYAIVDYDKPTEKLLNRSMGAIYVLSHLDGLWRYCSFLKFFPRGIADLLYMQIANHRYSVFGKRDTCLIPQEKYAERFIEA